MEAPTFFHNSFCPQFPASDNTDNNKNNNTDNFIVEDLLDLPNDDAIITDANIDSVAGNSTDSSTVTTVDSSNSSSFSGSHPNVVPGGISPVKTISPVSSDGNFSGELCVPYDDLAELEWLSNFVEESFSSEDLHKMQLISGVKARNDDASKISEFHSEPKRNSPCPSPSPIFDTEVSVPAKARTKRTRAAPCNWTSRLLVLSPTKSFSEPELFIPTPTHPSSVVAVSSKKPIKSASRRKDSSDGGSGGDGRKCQHCATDKTPQWRTGPMGPKTLCNACGVRYKSGRLVPEYRPASSPTFVLTKHSNSHRKVLELRRQKEMVRAQQHQQHQPFLHHHHHPNVMFDVSNGDDYLIYQHVGPDFRQLI